MKLSYLLIAVVIFVASITGVYSIAKSYHAKHCSGDTVKDGVRYHSCKQAYPF